MKKFFFKLLQQAMIYVSVIVLIYFKAYAKQDETFLTCLGKEETALLKLGAKFPNGPVAYLNQQLIQSLAYASSVKLKNQYLQQVCDSKKRSSSLTMLYLLLIHKSDIFIIPQSEDKKDILAKSNISSLVDDAPYLFFQYLSQLQGVMPHATCLPDNISEIAYFHERFKHLEEDLGPKKLANETDKIMSIFNKLDNLDNIYIRCQKRASKKNSN